MTVSPFEIPTSIQDKVREIMSRNQARFGHDAFRMEGEEDDAAAAAAKAAADAAAAKAVEDKAAADKAAADAAKNEKIEDLPDWAQKVIKDARADAGKARTDAKKTAAEEASAATLTKVLEALGVKGNKTPTLEEVQQELDKVKNENGSKDTTLTETRIELAVYRGAGKAGGDPDALLDSRTFLEKAKALDINAKDFNDKLTEAIKAAVKDNPKLKAGQASAGSSSADHGAGGSGEGGQRKPVSLDQAVGGHYGT